ncbi:MAG: nucleotidyltransferase domain-containing protein [Clostridia bacterium]|nr:nucleotidyltransferase domain-containing protein [Clostridia bacterium]MDD4048710.1 nucleotidyltransferase domain-containing protein [Clostridia bacterium]
MQNKIIRSELEKIEKEHNVRILYACESGSRAWGFHSKDSDYDVRFIYIHPIEWYLSIYEKRDVIEIPIDDVLDINGWDIRKALKLFRKSNPPMLEWLQSPIVYLEQFSVAQEIRNLIPTAFSPISSLNHYLGMAKGNYRNYLQGDMVRIKKYFYVLRPILASKWIVENGTVPPIKFDVLVEAIIPKGQLKSEIISLLERKKASNELDNEPRKAVINDYIKRNIAHLDNYIKTISKIKQTDEKVFDSLFRKALKEVWGHFY